MAEVPQFGAMMMKAGSQAFMDVSAAAVKSMERLAHTQLKIARDAASHGAEGMKALTTAKSPQEIMRIQATWANASMEAMTALTGALCGAGVDMAKAITKTNEGQVAELGQRVHEAIEQFAKYAPAGTESGVALARQAWNAAGQAYETASKATRQAIAVAEQNVESVGKASLNLVKSA